jgi:hypothetical protein
VLELLKKMLYGSKVTTETANVKFSMLNVELMKKSIIYYSKFNILSREGAWELARDRVFRISS